MAEINKEWLKSVGVSSLDEDTKRLTTKISDEFEMRVGNTLVAQLTSKQFAEFEKLIGGTSKDENAAVAWLDKTLPDYPEVVSKQEEQLRKELLRADDKVGLIETWGQ